MSRQRRDRAVACRRERRCGIGVTRRRERIVTGGEPRGERAVEAIAGARRVDGVDAMTGDALAPAPIGYDTPGRTAAKNHQRRAVSVACIEDRVGLVAPEQQLRVLEAG